MGIAHYPEHGTDAETLLQRADVAMYMAKDERSGPRLLRPRERPPRPRTAWRSWASCGGPSATTSSCCTTSPRSTCGPAEVSGVEALVRWHHPIRGLLAPDGVRPARRARRAHAPAHPAGCSIARSASAARGATEGIELRVAVNLAVPSLLDVQLAEDVARLLAQARGARRTCSSSRSPRARVMTDPERAIAKLRGAERHGRAPRRSTTSAPATRRCRTCGACRSTS